MDGSDVAFIYNNTNIFERFSGITVDLTQSRLYWSEFIAQKIVSSDLQGEDVRTVLDICPKILCSAPFVIGMYRNRIYWRKYDEQVESRAMQYLNYAEGSEIISKSVQPEGFSNCSGLR